MNTNVCHVWAQDHQILWRNFFIELMKFLEIFNCCRRDLNLLTSISQTILNYFLALTVHASITLVYKDDLLLFVYIL
jgi:hypothetical protein